jgi:hypothetical protein
MKKVFFLGFSKINLKVEKIEKIFVEKLNKR